MGELGFSTPPVWFGHNVAENWGEVEMLAGVKDWCAPTAIFFAPRGFDSVRTGPELREHVLAVRLSGADVEAPLHARTLRDGGGYTADFTLMAMGSPGRFVARSAIEYGHIYFADSALRRFAIELYGDRGDRSELVRDDLVFIGDRPLRSMINAYLERARGEGGAPTVLEMDSRATLIGLHLLMHHGTLGASKAPSTTGLSAWQAKRATDYISTMLHRELSLGELAAEVGLSPYHFCRAFKKTMGVSPSVWQRERRMTEAQELLRDERRSIIEIALELGYGSHSAFTSAFRRVCGQSPSAWRRARLR